MAHNVRETLNSILQAFESGNIPEAIAHSMFPIPDLPSSKWSFLNRITIFLSGTADARGFRQWMDAGRHVKKGAKAIYILVPRMIKREVALETGEPEEQEILAGFMGRPVFRVEDTEGEPLDYQQIELPPLPLMQRAREWGLSVKAVPGNYHYHGYFSQEKREIGLASKDEAVFFHELSHAAHMKIVGDLRTLPSWEKEVVAELAAAALCRIVGRESDQLGGSFQYISHYAEQEGLSPVKACLKVISQTEAVLTAILQGPPSSSTGQGEQSSAYVFAGTRAAATLPAHAALKKVAAYASRETGDACNAFDLLAKAVCVGEETSGHLGEKEVDIAESRLEVDKTIELINALATQQRLALQACYRLLSKGESKVSTSQSYETYRSLCQEQKTRRLTQRRFCDMVGFLDLYGLINARIVSLGRYGKTRKIMSSLPDRVVKGLV